MGIEGTHWRLPHLVQLWLTTMSTPFGSAFPESDSNRESTLKNVERQSNTGGAVRASDRFCEQVAPQATRYAMSIVRVWADAEEIVQEAFCRMVQSDRLSEEADFDTDSAQRALFFAMVRNLSIDRLRKKKRRRFEPMDVGKLATNKNHSDETTLQRLEKSVQAILKELPSQWSDALQLKVNGGLSYEEISNVLDATHAQVRTWIYRARKQLEKDLAQQGLLN